MCKNNANNLHELTKFYRVTKELKNINKEIENCDPNSPIFKALQKKQNNAATEQYRLLSKNHLNPRFKQYPAHNKTKNDINTQPTLFDFWKKQNNISKSNLYATKSELKQTV